MRKYKVWQLYIHTESNFQQRVGCHCNKLSHWLCSCLEFRSRNTRFGSHCFTQDQFQETSLKTCSKRCILCASNGTSFNRVWCKEGPWNNDLCVSSCAPFTKSICSFRGRGSVRAVVQRCNFVAPPHVVPHIYEAVLKNAPPSFFFLFFDRNSLHWPTFLMYICMCHTLYTVGFNIKRNNLIPLKFRPVKTLDTTGIDEC